MPRVKPGSASFHLPSLGRKGEVAITGSPFCPEEPRQPAKGPGAPAGHHADDTPGSPPGAVSSSCPQIGRKGQALGGHSGEVQELGFLSRRMFPPSAFSGLAALVSSKLHFLRRRSVGPTAQSTHAVPRRSPPFPASGLSGLSLRLHECGCFPSSASPDGGRVENWGESSPRPTQGDLPSVAQAAPSWPRPRPRRGVTYHSRFPEPLSRPDHLPLPIPGANTGPRSFSKAHLPVGGRPLRHLGLLLSVSDASRPLAIQGVNPQQQPLSQWGSKCRACGLSGEHSRCGPPPPRGFHSLPAASAAGAPPFPMPAPPAS